METLIGVLGEEEGQGPVVQLTFHCCGTVLLDLPEKIPGWERGSQKRYRHLEFWKRFCRYSETPCASGRVDFLERPVMGFVFRTEHNLAQSKKKTGTFSESFLNCVLVLPPRRPSPNRIC
ncbi:hypothetical protein Cadr_000019520 [Camelus dromedarius]|uniref:Uncharacterized protein n=1 Tax=Camelus dromedarius TaxID=9838 RepID=A0A5N4D520_CAMDR|nr:hypothetical protein Cadr_000019520 [Camelus dromedarius]